MRFASALIAVLFILGVPGCGPRTETAARVQPTQHQASESQQEAAPAQEEKGLPKLWDFTSERCPPCRVQNPIIHTLEKEYSDQVVIRIIDVDQNQQIARKYNIRFIPTQIFLDSEGKELSRHVGLFQRDSIINRFKAHGFID